MLISRYLDWLLALVAAVARFSNPRATRASASVASEIMIWNMDTSIGIRKHHFSWQACEYDKIG